MYFLGLKEFLRHYERLRDIKIYIMSVTGFCGIFEIMDFSIYISHFFPYLGSI